MPESFPLDTRENAGNMIHANAPFEMYGERAIHSKSSHWRELGYTSFANFVNRECSHLIVTMANTLRDGVMDGQRYVSFRRSLEQYQVPLVMFGCGVQATHTRVEEVKLAPEAIEMVRYFSSRTIAFGVRGQFTADVLHHHAGTTNTFVIGCPSLFSRPQGIARLRRELENGSEGTVAFCGTDFTRPAEQQLFRKAFECESFIIEPVNKIMYATSLGLGDALPAGLRQLGLDRRELVKFLRRRLRLFRQTYEWYQFNESSVSRTYGTRFHVNMASILSGKPALWLTHDSRTRELVEAMNLPSAPLSDTSDESIISRPPDYTDFFASIDQHFERFSEYLSLNKLPSVATLSEVERGIRQVPVAASPTLQTADNIPAPLLPAEVAEKAGQLHESAKSLLADRRFAEAVLESNRCRDLVASYFYDFRQQLEQGAVPRCSIVIVTYRNEPDFSAALWRVHEATKDKGYEVIVVDNGNSLARSTVAAFPGWLYVEMGFNYGCSGGRNTGAALATGKYVVFLDDDGLIEGDAIAALIESIEVNQAAAVRGRVVPKTPGSPKSTSYDLGVSTRPSAIDAEGVSIFRRDLFLRAGGFDPLLSGHEGIVLSAKLIKLAGPFSLLYEPTAVLLHDFSASSQDAEAKVARQALNKEFALFICAEAYELHLALRNYDRLPHSIAGFALRSDFRRYTSLDRAAEDLPRVSILTTARNAAKFLQSYADSLRAQTHGNFEIVFVDDGSTDGTAELIQKLFEGDSRLRLVSAPQLGRSAALNLAITNASNEICLIADADDMSLMTRVAATAMIFTDDPSLACLSLWMFTDRNAAHVGRPHSVAAGDFSIRSLFGMPASFPAFAFRKSSFQLPFDTSLTAGVDCDWILRNMWASPTLRGKMFSIHGAYYRLHDAQISSTKRDIQRVVATGRAIEAHERLIGGRLTAGERAAVEVLTGWTRAEVSDLPALRSYGARLLAAAHKQPAMVEVLSGYLAQRLAEIQFELGSAKTENGAAKKTKGKPPGMKESARMLILATKRRLKASLVVLGNSSRSTSTKP